MVYLLSLLRLEYLHISTDGSDNSTYLLFYIREDDLIADSLTRMGSKTLLL